MPTPPTKIEHLTERMHRYFWARVDGTRGLFDCWMWIGTTNKKSGYGIMRLDGHTAGAHRVSWFIHNGVIPDGMEIMHECDTPGCVNPLHLKPGTHLENIQDRDRKQRRRQPKGELNNMAKLTAEKVVEIRRLHKTGMSTRAIAVMFNVTQVCIVYVCNGHSWAHVPDPD